MLTDKPPITVYKCVLGGVFTGLLAALAVVLFNIVYRSMTGFIAFAIVVPVSSFLLLPVINLLAGCVYFLFARKGKNGRIFYRIIVILTMLGGTYSTAFGYHPAGQMQELVTGLVFGIELIEGSLAAMLLPYLAEHPKMFLGDAGTWNIK